MIKNYFNKNFLVELLIYNVSMSGIWSSLIVSPVYLIKENSPYFILVITILISGISTLFSLYKKEFNQYNQNIYFYIHFITISLLYISLLIESKEYFYFVCFMNSVSSLITISFAYSLPQNSLTLFSLEKSLKDILPENSECFIKDLLNNSYTIVYSKLISNINILYIKNLNKYLKVIKDDKALSVYISLSKNKNDVESFNLNDLYKYIEDNNLNFKELTVEDLEILNMCKI